MPRIRRILPGFCNCCGASSDLKRCQGCRDREKAAREARAAAMRCTACGVNRPVPGHALCETCASVANRRATDSYRRLRAVGAGDPVQDFDSVL